MNALIKVDYACNNNCVFCHSAEHKGRAPAASVDAKIALAAGLGCSMVVLSGGEPTIQPRLMGWARLARQEGLGFGLVSNGRMLAYPEAAQRLSSAGLTYAQVSLHAGTAALHDRITRTPGSFDQTLAAVGSLLDAGVETTVNAVVTRANASHLDGLVDLLLPQAGLRLKYSMVEPKGAALARFEEVVPPLEEAAAGVAAALGRAQRCHQDLAHEGFPLCLVGPKLQGLACDLRSEGFAYMSEVDEAEFFPVDAKNRTLPDGCEACGLARTCPGVYRQYLARRARRGVPDLHPVDGEQILDT